MNTFWLIVGSIVATAVVFAYLAPVLLCGAKRFADMKGHRAAFALLIAALVVYAGAKHKVPIVEKPAWLFVEAVVDTNTWDRAVFSWHVTGHVPADTPLFIDTAKPQGAVTNWTSHATVYGARSNTLFFAENPTNYIARVRCDYVPGAIEIKDFLARASLTNRIVDITFTVPTNVIGQTGAVEYRLKRANEPWRLLGTHLAEATNNHYRAVGNFISRGIDREFRIRFDDAVITPLEAAR